jgi:polysaccharide biosynthesis/export protein
MHRFFAIIATAIVLCIGFPLVAVAQVKPFTNPYQNPYGGSRGTSTTTTNSPAGTTTTRKASPATANTSNEPDKKTKGGKAAKSSDKDPKTADLTDANEGGPDEEVSQDRDDGDSTEVNANKQAYDEGSIYGSNFLNSQARNINSSGGSNFTSPPASYKLGIGDEIIVNVWGTSEYQETYTIGKDGSIFPKSIGKINLAGLSFSSAQQVISSRFRSVLTSGSNVDVQLASVRLIKVTVMGEVNAPGTLSISAFNTAFNAINMAGGVTSLANLRSIQIKRGNRTVNTIDLYEFLNTGDIDDAYLQDGDIVLIDVFEKKVKAEGKFKRPMYYLLKQEEDLTDLIRYSGGPTYDARFSSIQILTISEEQPILYSLNLKDIDAGGGTISLKDGDVVRIKSINADMMNTVDVQGAVMYPDQYQIVAGDRLLDVLQKAGGLLPNALQNNAFIFRGENSAEANAIKVNLDSLDPNDYRQNVELFAGDKINLISKNSLVNKYTVEIYGEVRNPQSFSFVQGMTLRDIVLLAGGMNPQAEGNRIEIARCIDTVLNPYEFRTNNNSTVSNFTVDLDPDIENSAQTDFLLKPFDKVYIRTKPNFKLTQTVTLIGEVTYAGSYPILTEGERLSSVIQRAGGLRSTAFTQGSKLYRANVGEVLMTLDEIITNPNSVNDLVLKPRDTIFVPSASELVRVQGAVQNQINIKASSVDFSVEHYVSAAGGFTERPWKDRIYVQYPNGASKSTKKFLGVRTYPPVVPGCVVVVPVKPLPADDVWSWRDSQGFMLSLMSIITTGVTTYGILFKKP